MRLGNCSRCGTRLRAGTGTCPRCSARKQRVKYALAALVTVEALVIAVHMEFPGGHGPRVVSEAQAAVSPLMQVLNEAKPPAGWVYYETRDDMIYDVTHHARVISRSAAAGSGPASHNATTGVLELRRSQVYGNSVLITLLGAASDQLASHCTVRAIFDGNDTATFDATAGQDDHNATVIISDARRFVRRLAEAQTLSVDVLLSANAERVASFPVGGLRWD
jgi:hypothetical protein